MGTTALLSHGKPIGGPSAGPDPTPGNPIAAGGWGSWGKPRAAGSGCS